MRSNYTDEEQKALLTLSELLAGEVSRATKILVADLNHMPGCESPEHRATIVKQAKECVKNLLNSLRYAAWIEAEMSEIRVFQSPQANLKQIEDTLTAVAEKYAPQEVEVTPPADNVVVPVTPEVEVTPPPEIEIVPPEKMIERVTELQMDKQATAPFPTTKQ